MKKARVLRNFVAGSLHDEETICQPPAAPNVVRRSTKDWMIFNIISSCAFTAFSSARTTGGWNFTDAAKAAIMPTCPSAVQSAGTIGWICADIPCIERKSMKPNRTSTRKECEYTNKSYLPVYVDDLEAVGLGKQPITSVKRVRRSFTVNTAPRLSPNYFNIRPFCFAPAFSIFQKHHEYLQQR